MVLVTYSDSEGSDTEDSPPKAPPATEITPTTATKPSTSSFTVDKGNPSRIRVNLTSSLPAPSKDDEEDGEPAAKRARVGNARGGAFSGFNAMLPAPKHDNLKEGLTGTNGNKPPTRKVFSLKTGAEPAFSRDSDAELRDFFAEQQQGQEPDDTSTIPIQNQKPESATGPPPTTTGKAFMFKPLSVSRGPKKKKKAPSQVMKEPDMSAQQPTSHASVAQTTQPKIQNNVTESEQLPVSKPKISLFSSGPSSLPPDPDLDPDEEDEIIEVLDDPDPSSSTFTDTISTPSQFRQPQQSDSLNSLANDLNLSAAERRQLLGRNHNTSNTSFSNGKIISFNTDTEYAANQAFLAANAEANAQQHNPVRAIGGGKHSLKSLVANAQGQKEALEESFAVGRRNKREAGGKYGW